MGFRKRAGYMSANPARISAKEPLLQERAGPPAVLPWQQRVTGVNKGLEFDLAYG